MKRARLTVHCETNRLCFNYLREHHSMRAKGLCQRCRQKDHTSLYLGNNQSDKRVKNTLQPKTKYISCNGGSHEYISPYTGATLFKAALNNLNSENNKVTVNILLDEGVYICTDYTIKCFNY